MNSAEFGRISFKLAGHLSEFLIVTFVKVNGSSKVPLCNPLASLQYSHPSSYRVKLIYFEQEVKAN